MANIKEKSCGFSSTHGIYTPGFPCFKSVSELGVNFNTGNIVDRTKMRIF